MYKKYKSPLSLFIILEKAPIIFWTTKSLTPNHNIIYLSKKWLYLSSQIFKNEMFFSNNFLVENSAIDTSNFETLPFTIKKNFFNNILIFYTFYFYNLKLKLTLFFGNNILKENRYNSIDKIYNNANWLERETSEMYNILYTAKNDTRRLLLDYSRNENPLLKNYSCDGNSDLFFNLFENQIYSKKAEVVEL